MSSPIPIVLVVVVALVLDSPPITADQRIHSHSRTRTSRLSPRLLSRQFGDDSRAGAGGRPDAHLSPIGRQTLGHAAQAMSFAAGLRIDPGAGITDDGDDAPTPALCPNARRIDDAHLHFGARDAGMAQAVGERFLNDTRQLILLLAGE